MQKQGVILTARIEVTNHALERLKTRWKFKSFKGVLPYKDLILYKDLNQTDVYYSNIGSQGFVVLRRTKELKFVIITITKEELRNYGSPLVIKTPIIRELQYEQW